MAGDGGPGDQDVRVVGVGLAGERGAQRHLDKLGPDYDIALAEGGQLVEAELVARELDTPAGGHRTDYTQAEQQQQELLKFKHGQVL